MPRLRLDTLLVNRGLAASRERARAMVLAGRVRVKMLPQPKPGALVDEQVEIELLGPDHPYVSRGGIKLAHALDALGLIVEGREALDIGASTGGFTDVLLRRGATAVVALDVGHGQLDWRLRNDPRVFVVEGVNARALTPGQLPDHRRSFDIVTIDVAFISLRYILPVVPPLLRLGANVLALVKPQFEAGRAEVGSGGVVRDPAIRLRVVDEVTRAAADLGLRTCGTVPSPITGAEGNVEIFVHLRAGSNDRAASDG
ncbi:MAG: TlyA family rRNA (cytidine-2'-O)-methyltransferase [Luteitalea sp.]|nr:TlyA family rRNA (cytidine-2'-O)-methyltransferase [Luteitalea sp.]